MDQSSGDARREYDAAAIERLLYGTDPTPRIVAVEAAGASGMRVYQRDTDDRGPGRGGMRGGPAGLPGQLPPTTAPEDGEGSAS